jgi:hypothetical protein
MRRAGKRLVPSYAILLATADRNIAETGTQQIPSNHTPSASGTGVQTLSGEAVLDALNVIPVGASAPHWLKCSQVWLARSRGLPARMRTSWEGRKP